MSSIDIRRDDGITWLRLDDGKANALSVSTIAELNEALTDAEQRQDVVVLTGRPGIFCAGFDLEVIRLGLASSVDLIMAGLGLARRLLGSARPVVIGCTGHALAMGALLLLGADHRIGVAGNARIGTNEVAIGMVMPRAGIELMRQRLTPAGVRHAGVLARVFSPDDAAAVGFLDEVVEPAHLEGRLSDAASELMRLDPRAYRETKRRCQVAALAEIDAALEADHADFHELIARSRRSAVSQQG